MLFEQRGGRSLPDGQAGIAAEPAAREKLLVLRVEERLLLRVDGAQYAVRRGARSGIGRPRSLQRGVIRLEPPLDGLNGVVHRRLDERHVEKAVTTRAFRRHSLQRNLVPIRHGVGVRRRRPAQADADEKTREVPLSHGCSLPHRSKLAKVAAGAQYPAL